MCVVQTRKYGEGEVRKRLEGGGRGERVCEFVSKSDRYQRLGWCLCLGGVAFCGVRDTSFAIETLNPRFVDLYFATAIT